MSMPNPFRAQAAESPQGQQPGGQQAPSSNRILVKNIKVTGNTVFSNEVLATVTNPYLGKSLTLPELEEVATALTQFYKENGYTLANAYLP